MSAGFSPLSLGTETDGSLVQPAARAALYALKPTVGSTDHRGVWTLSKRFDAVGAIAKSVSDLALATEMLHTMEVRSRLPEDGYLSFLSKSFTGLKVGFLDESQWHLPPQMCPQIPSVVQQLVRGIWPTSGSATDLHNRMAHTSLLLRRFGMPELRYSIR